MPKAQKEVFVLSRIKGIKYKEIAKKLNVSERTVEVRISQSLKTLRTLLKDFFLLIAVCTLYDEIKKILFSLWIFWGSNVLLIERDKNGMIEREY